MPSSKYRKRIDDGISKGERQRNKVKLFVITGFSYESGFLASSLHLFFNDEASICANTLACVPPLRKFRACQQN
jgi:hypothetical protein